MNAGSELDLTNSHVLRQRLDAAFKRTEGSVILVCTQLDVVDHVGLQMLVDKAREAHDAGLRLRVVNPSRALTDMLALTGTADEFDLDKGTRDEIVGRVPAH
jgi:anti-anti-sigma factor